MKCEKGSVMLEILVSLSLLMMTVSLLLPQTLLIMQERKNIQLRYNAQLFLKEAAATYMYHHVISPVIEKQYENVTYRIRWQDEKVCVRWQDIKRREIERCRYVKK
ncbi:competence type IV pilus minor pilin ComGE [Bacillus sp. GB_SG_008]|uniref:competence type IV pilus minor pilin ComGE n=1 Tax=Bacillus sp. GB_SG_008 TaxID=3454627 RepID=UPI003F85FDE7